MTKTKRKIHVRTWIITLGGSNPDDNEDVRVKAQTKEEAKDLIKDSLTYGKSIISVRPARKSKFD